MLCRAILNRQVDPQTGHALLRKVLYDRRRHVRQIFRAWKKRYEHRLFDAMIMTGHASVQMDISELTEEASRVLGHEQ